MTNIVGKTDSSFLDWTQRPAHVKEAVDRAFAKIADHESSSWGIYNGLDRYNICQVREHKLFHTMILEMQKTKKTFFALDIGAGDFSWGLSLADFLNKQDGIDPDVHIHIVGVRGEKNCKEKKITCGKCTEHRLGNFKVEEIFSQMKETFSPLPSFDLIVSRWCFRHLADPVGTFQQTYNFLCPQSGFLFLDGFFFSVNGAPDFKNVNNRNPLDFNPNKRMTELVGDAGATFIETIYNEGRSLNHFVIQKPFDGPVKIPLKYSNEQLEQCLFLQSDFQIGADFVTQFAQDPDLPHRKYVYPASNLRGQAYSGDKKLFKRLQKANHFKKNNYIDGRFFVEVPWRRSLPRKCKKLVSVK